MIDKMMVASLLLFGCWLIAASPEVFADSDAELGTYTVNATWPNLVAADWTAPESEWISSVLFYAGWEADSFGELDSIGLSIYDDAIHGQGTCWYNQPEDPLWTFVATEFTIDSPTAAPSARTWCIPNPVSFTDGDNSYSFPVSIELDSINWFWSEMGETYWLAVSLFPAASACGIVTDVEQRGELAAAVIVSEWEWITLDYFFVQGDMNCDDLIDGTDFAILQQDCGIGLFPAPTFPGGVPGVNGDLNCDGLANMTDCVYFIQWWQNGGPPIYTNCYYEPRDPVEAAIYVNTTPAPYICGDPNRDGVQNVTDCVYLVQFIFSGGSGPDPVASGDPNCDGLTNITDAVYLIAYIFGGGPAPCENCP